MDQTRYVDAHCHLTSEPLLSTLDDVIASAASHGIVGFAQGGGDPAEWQLQDAIVARYPAAIYPVYGLHPWAIHQGDDEQAGSALAELERRLDQGPQPVALGELGLDRALRGYKDSWERQRRLFQAQLELAAAHHLPIVLHVVQAHGIALETLSAFAGLIPGGFVHAFAGDYSIANQYWQLGLHVSLAPGSLSRMDQATIARLDPASILIESDAPDAAIPADRKVSGPLPPLALLDVAQAVGAARGESPSEVLERSTATLKKLLRLDRAPLV